MVSLEDLWGSAMDLVPRRLLLIIIIVIIVIVINIIIIVIVIVGIIVVIIMIILSLLLSLLLSLSLPLPFLLLLFLLLLFHVARQHPWHRSLQGGKRLHYWLYYGKCWLPSDLFAIFAVLACFLCLMTMDHRKMQSSVCISKF